MSRKSNKTLGYEKSTLPKGTTSRNSNLLNKQASLKKSNIEINAYS